MRRLLFTFFILLIFTPSAHAVDVTLAWDPVIDPALAGYKLYYGTTSRAYGTPVDVGNVTEYKLTGLPDGKTAYFAVTAYDKNKNESAFSIELVAYTIIPSVFGPGTIKPSVPTMVDVVYPMTFEMIPSEGAFLSNVIVDNASAGSISSYPFTNVTSNREISATFITNTGINIAVVTPANYIPTSLRVGSAYYIDRPFMLLSIPAELATGNEKWIKTANADKNQTSDSFLQFTIPQSARILIAYDSRAVSLPAWLSGSFKLTSLTIGVSDEMGNFKVYEKIFPQGTVVLGGNAVNSDLSNYIVIVQPVTPQQLPAIEGLKITQ